MVDRRKTTQIQIANVGIGSDFPISVQSMTNTDTRDITGTVAQIKQLEEAGCELVRLAVVDKDAAKSIKEIKQKINIPVIADIHFNHELAIESINNGADALRLNPGNIGNEIAIKKVVELAKQKQTPIRIGVNAGSLEKEFLHMPVVEGMLNSALKHIKILENLDFKLIKVSLKSSSVPITIKAYEALANLIDYPMHIGLTEAGTLKTGSIKSSIGIGYLLSRGIGDTIRVSLTENPIEEVIVAYEILKALEIRQRGINFISCPTCGRCQIDVINLTKTLEEKLSDSKAPITIAIMGCAVNGPGEASHADIGIAGGNDKCVLFKKGQIIKTAPQKEILEILLNEINSIL